MSKSGSRRVITIVAGVLVVAIVVFLAVGLIFQDSFPGQMLQGSAVRIQSGGSQPAYGEGITVDGNTGDWDLTADYFADMYRAAKPNQPLESRLYLRYECGQGILYVLVLGADGVPVLAQPADAYVKILELGDSPVVGGNSGNDGTPPDFSWVDLGYDGDGSHARGWEGSFSIAQGDYTINAHTQVLDDGSSQTSAVANRAYGFTLQCTPPTAISLISFTASWGSGTGFASSQTGATGVVLRWETASELDNVGFNIYRAARENGPWKLLNKQLIPTQVPPGSPVGASYEWTDSKAKEGQKYFYLLEDVDIHGETSKHGPVVP
jgi:hypothetical protein